MLSCRASFPDCEIGLPRPGRAESRAMASATGADGDGDESSVPDWVTAWIRRWSGISRCYVMPASESAVCARTEAGLGDVLSEGDF